MNETASTDFGNYWDGCLLLSLKRLSKLTPCLMAQQWHCSLFWLLVYLVAQSVILFINRVKPVRFVFSLLIEQSCLRLATYSWF